MVIDHWELWVESWPLAAPEAVVVAVAVALDRQVPPRRHRECCRPPNCWVRLDRVGGIDRTWCPPQRPAIDDLPVRA